MYQHMFHICFYICYLNVYVCDMYASAPWQLSRNKLYIAFEVSECIKDVQTDCGHLLF